MFTLTSNVVKLNPALCLKTRLWEKRKMEKKFVQLCKNQRASENQGANKNKGQMQTKKLMPWIYWPTLSNKALSFRCTGPKNKSLFAFCAQVQKTKAFIHSTFLASPCLECLLHKAKLWIGNICALCRLYLYICTYT